MAAPSSTLLTNDNQSRHEALDVLENTDSAMIEINSEYSDDF